MRVLHCISSLEGGGAERQLCYLAAGLVGLGHSVHVALMRHGALSPRLAASGAEVHQVPHRPRINAALVTDLCRVIRRSNADLVQTWLRRTDIGGGIAARLMRRPWIYSERSLFQPGGLRQSVRRALLSRACCIVANSESGAATWRRRRGPRLHVVPNALPLDEIAAAPAVARGAFGVPDDSELVIYVGRFTFEKNPELLAEILTRVLVRRPQAWAVCCGVEGPGREQFGARIEAAGVLPRCVLPGWRSDVWSLMKSADAIVSTSRWEGRPNVVLEAMACHCPLVLSDIPPHREVAGDDALYFAGDSAESGAGAIDMALDDRAAARVRAHRAAGRCEPLSLRSVASAYAAIYEELL